MVVRGAIINDEKCYDAVIGCDALTGHAAQCHILEPEGWRPDFGISRIISVLARSVGGVCGVVFVVWCGVLWCVCLA